MRKSNILNIDVVHYQGLRLCLAAFTVLRGKSLYVEADETSLPHRRLKLNHKYACFFNAFSKDYINHCVFIGIFLKNMRTYFLN